MDCIGCHYAPTTVGKNVVKEHLTQSYEEYGGKIFLAVRVKLVVEWDKRLRGIVMGCYW